MKKTILFITLISICNLFSQSLDTSFGTNGYVNFNHIPLNSYDLIRDVELQSDGKFLFLTNEFLARYDAYDNLDTSFSTCGMKEISGAKVMKLLNNGKIIVFSITGKTIFKFNNDGSIDTTFGTNGKVSLPITNTIIVNQIEETLDNKIVLGGGMNTGTKTDFLLIKLTTNGNLDVTFDTDGIAKYSIGTIQDIGSALAIQSDNKIILTGKTKISSTNDDFATIRVTNSGALDMSFGINGIKLTEFSSNSNDYPTSISIDNLGKIYVAGTTKSGSSTTRLAIVKYNIDGSNDNNFNTTGKLLGQDYYAVHNSFSSQTINNSWQFSSNSKVEIKSTPTALFVSTSGYPEGYRIWKISLTNLSSVTQTLEVGQEYYNNFLILSNNYLYIGGYSKPSTGDSNPYIAKLKYDTNLQFLSLSTLNIKQSDEKGNYLIPTNNNIYIKSKNSNINTNYNRYKVFKTSNTGVIDDSFTEQQTMNNRFTFYIDNNDKLYSYDISVNQNKIYRYDLNGTIDTSFGNLGVLDVTGILNGSITFINAIKVDGNNNIYIACDYDNSIDNSSIGIIKLNYQGQLDANFGVNGVAFYKFNSVTSNDYEYPGDLIIDDQGNVTVYGFTGNTNKTLMYKINNQGSLISSFGTNGKKIIDNIKFTNVKRTNSNNYFLGDNRIMKINDQGNEELTFGVNGTLTVNSLDNFNDYLIKACDGIYVAGSKDNQFAIAKYTLNGELDSSFGTNGVFINISSFCSSEIDNISFTQNNAITALGNYWNGIGNKLTLFRLLNVTNNPVLPPSANTDQSFELGSILANLSVTGTNLQWYSNSTGGTPLPLSTVLVDGATYYVSQTVNGCESSRIAITVTQNLRNEDFAIITIDIYPNPTTSILNFKSAVQVEKIAIYNMLGQLVQQEKVNASEGTINIEKLVQGTYLVKVNDIDKGYTIIKN
jgi:uncharacterized delta-60 repeat protein